MTKSYDFLKPIGEKSTVDQIIDSIIEAIVTKKLTRGSKIPTEVELCKLFNVGRNSVREAVKVLVSLGILEIRRSDGTYVVDKYSKNTFNPLLYSLVLEDDHSLSLLELREVLDYGSAILAIKKADESDRARIKAACDRLVEFLKTDFDDMKELLQLDINFHRMIDEASHNPLILRLNSIIAEMSSASRLKTLLHVIKINDVQFLIDSHIKITDAIINKKENVIHENIQFSNKYWSEILEGGS